MSDTHAQSVAFVRETEIPPSPPPVAQAGAVKWVRENLFSGVFNTVLTLIALYVVARLAIAVFPWFYNGVWEAESIRDCRDQLDGATGACFAVLVDRWDHLLFGFKYPQDGYWRILLAFVLLMAAAAPALFQKLPRKMLLFTALYPFLAYWLIWGGSLWMPVTLLALVIATGLVFQLVARQISVDMRKIVSGVIGVICGVGLTYLLFIGAQELVFIAGSVGTEGIVSSVAYGLFWLMAIFTFALCVPMGIFVGYAIFNSYEDGGLVSVVTALLFIYVALTYLLGPIWMALNGVFPIELQEVASRDMGGFMLNMILGTVCVSLSIPLGILLALGRQSSMPLIKGVCVVFIEFIRGVPLITLLFVANVMLAYFLPPESNFDLILRVIIMITMFSAAYIAEVIRGGLAALPKGQYEAADSLGLDYTQATRLIILPQALKISIPGIVNVAVGLFKDTTLVSIISMFDLVGMIRGPIQNSTEWISVYWEVYGFGALLFFVVCYSISQYSQWLERQLNTSHR
ncbi:amino acid ABC transporter permease [Litoreibacter arenae]|uniref:Glutamate transport membrane-spanning protein n=1 Tax=Litoreibacter arenae DSM 19593 TaxID=1123360 RepID=S9QA13_9RHOB|nr:amino acid ABC transporter permease [Litoreibacter arenae]EPX76857.1 Glutamate transport membrane-spanning protein [Litoreibacter arenae DSM 19593]